MKQLAPEEFVQLLETFKELVMEEAEEGILSYDYINGYLDACNELLQHVYEDYDD